MRRQVALLANDDSAYACCMRIYKYTSVLFGCFFEETGELSIRPTDTASGIGAKKIRTQKEALYDGTRR